MNEFIRSEAGPECCKLALKSPAIIKAVFWNQACISNGLRDIQWRIMTQWLTWPYLNDL